MFDILRHYGVPTKIVKAIEAIYHNSRSAVLIDGNISEEFDVTTDVLQRDTLAPFLFIIVIDYVMKNAQDEHTDEKGEHGFTTIHDLDFADDIALLENTLDRAQTQLNTTAKWVESVGLHVNIKKTKTQTINQYNSMDKASIE